MSWNLKPESVRSRASANKKNETETTERDKHEDADWSQDYRSLPVSAVLRNDKHRTQNVVTG